MHFEAVHAEVIVDRACIECKPAVQVLTTTIKNSVAAFCDVFAFDNVD